jgi:Cu-processing system permease protein
MFARVLVVALNTYRESVRAWILIGLAAVAFGVSIFALFVGALTLNDAPRVMSDIGSAAMSLFAVVVAVVISATSLHRELEQKTIFPILARPIARAEYLVGKYLGTVLTLSVFLMADSGVVLLLSAGLGGRSLALVGGLSAAFVVLLAVAVWRSPLARTFGPIPWSALLLIAGAVLAGVAPDERRVILGSAILSFAEVAIVAAIATLFSSFSTPFVSALLTLGVWLVGRSADSLAHMPARYVGEWMRQGGAVLARIVPNLQVYVPPRPLLTGEAPGVQLGPYIGEALLQAGCWSVLLLACSSAFFRRRDFL